MRGGGLEAVVSREIADEFGPLAGTTGHEEAAIDVRDINLETGRTRALASRFSGAGQGVCVSLAWVRPAMEHGRSAGSCEPRVVGLRRRESARRWENPLLVKALGTMLPDPPPSGTLGDGRRAGPRAAHRSALGKRSRMPFSTRTTSSGRRRPRPSRRRTPSSRSSQSSRGGFSTGRHCS